MMMVKELEEVMLEEKDNVIRMKTKCNINVT